MWRPEVYLKYGDERTRPARDLLRQVAPAAPSRVIDLGCGPGNSTALLRARWPDASVTGLDSSASMLAEARATGPDGVEWIEADVAAWAPAEPVDVVYSNAALHWLPDHGRLLPRLAAATVPGGALAIQMPRNFAAPSHTEIAEAARSDPWRGKLAPILRESRVREPAEYHRMLAPHVRRLEIWETEYLHRLSGEDPVYDWVKGTTMTPLLAVLEGDERVEFEAVCRKRLRTAYAREADGSTLFPFRRIFIVATP